MFNVSVNDKKNIYRSKPVMNVDTTGSSGDISVPKPLTYDYMPEGYPTKTIENTTILDETLTLEDAGDGSYSVIVQKAAQFSVGTTYKVIFNGEEYDCTAQDYEGFACLGNLSFAVSENPDFDTGEPFLINTEPGMNMYWVYANTANCTISVSGDLAVYNVMSDNFLPKYTKIIELLGPQVSVQEYIDATVEQGNTSAMIRWGSMFIFPSSTDIEKKTVTFYVINANSEFSVSWTEDSSDLSQCYLNVMHMKEVIPTEYQIASSPGKKFKITVDDSGIISATEVT